MAVLVLLFAAALTSLAIYSVRATWHPSTPLYLAALALVTSGSLLVLVDATSASVVRMISGSAVLALGIAMFIVGELTDHRR